MLDPGDRSARFSDVVSIEAPRRLLDFLEVYPAGAVGVKVDTARVGSPGWRVIDTGRR